MAYNHVGFPPFGTVTFGREIVAPPNKTFGKTTDRKLVGIYGRAHHNIVWIKLFAKLFAFGIISSGVVKIGCTEKMKHFVYDR